MSNPLLVELKQETDRLYIAGSELATGDFRLKRLLPRFETLAANAPVFGRLADFIRRLVEGAQDEGSGPAETLQELGLLLGSILATQSVAEPEGETVPLSASGLELNTPLTCRQLAVVEKALTESGGGRYEIVVDALQQGWFTDLRLFPLVVQALGDPYPELAEYVLKHILPLYGKSAIPYLIASFDPQGGKKEGRKLQALTALGVEAELILSAAEEGSEDVRVAAIECLSTFPDHTEVLIGYTRDRKKAVREAAYHALATGRSPSAVASVIAAFAGKDRELAAEALSRHSWPEVNQQLAPLLSSELKLASSGHWKQAEEKARTEAWSLIQSYLMALGDSREPCLDEAYAEVVRNSGAYQLPNWERMIEQAARYLAGSGTKDALELLFELEERHESTLPYSFQAAAVQLSPTDLFDRYGKDSKGISLFGSRRKPSRSGKVHPIIEAMTLHRESRTYHALMYSGNLQDVSRMEMLSPTRVAAEWDPRWLDWAIARDVFELVCVFARPGHRASRKYLIEKLTDPSTRSMRSIPQLMQGLERTGIETKEFQDLLVQCLEPKSNHTIYSLDYYLMEQLLKLPASYKERLQKLAERYRYESRKQLEYVLEEMGK